MRTRVIPVLLVEDGGLVKTVRFGKRTYIGDPINAIRLFNDMEVDELILVDISASRKGRGPDIELISDVASEAFMPMGYVGGIRSLDDVRDVLSVGFEKVGINRAAQNDLSLITAAAAEFGSQAIVACLDVKESFLRRRQAIDYVSGSKLGMSPVAFGQRAESAGAGELFLYDVGRDGTMQGYDIELIREVADAVSIPIIACGGAGSLEDLALAAQAGAGAVAAGSLFVYQGRHKGVLINYPSQEQLKQTLGGYR